MNPDLSSGSIDTDTAVGHIPAPGTRFPFVLGDIRQERGPMGANAIVHVIGTGTIGEPLIGLLCALKEPLGIEEVTFHKRTPLLTDRSKVVSLMKKGAKLCVGDSAAKGFQDLGMEPSFESVEAINRAAVVIDCTPSGVGTQNKADYYDKFTSNTNGFIAQGSEFGFGKPYARGINDDALIKGEDQFIQVVSCNTHNLSILIQALALSGGGPENLVEGKFVCMRRSNDISQTSGFVPSPQVGKHKDSRFGTHHARDAWHLYNTMGYDLPLFSTAIKLNTQYMHTIFFDITVKNPTSVEKLTAAIHANDRVAVTYKTAANDVFSFGRDQGHYGRILNVTVVALPTLTVRNETEIVGYCFTPQDGNSLLSSLSAATWFLYPDTYEDRIQCLKRFFYDEV
jgi:glyceraldehyde-3-phosphate dehydrogenase (NAD(P))